MAGYGPGNATPKVSPWPQAHFAGSGLCHCNILRPAPYKKPPPRTAHELMALFSRLGILKDLLTDQGTPFISKLMLDLRQPLQVKHLKISAYHPQTDGVLRDVIRPWKGCCNEWWIKRATNGTCFLCALHYLGDPTPRPLLVSLYLNSCLDEDPGACFT